MAFSFIRWFTKQSQIDLTIGARFQPIRARVWTGANVFRNGRMWLGIVARRLTLHPAICDETKTEALAVRLNLKEKTLLEHLYSRIVITKNALCFDKHLKQAHSFKSFTWNFVCLTIHLQKWLLITKLAC